ncbi:GNAT family N-acetyltransferase [Catenulispora sp. GP43]|uniref:GNAT family N-acetyltransferase n=1 Tax=Catenulispora sp. GP43 TaxID=3156263 RepID=UPI003517F972
MPERVIRPRRPTDLPACAEALRGVHETDGYPVRWPADPQGWLTPRDMIGCWIATAGDTDTDTDRVLGHVALTRAGAAIAEALALPAAKLALVARLFVAVDARRGGLATDLLDRAARAARDEGLQAVLEVDAAAAGAIALYERAGWRLAGSGDGGWIAADGLPARVRFYVGPVG